MSASGAMMTAFSGSGFAGGLVIVFAIGLMIANAVLILVCIMRTLATLVADAVTVVILGFTTVRTLVLAVVTDLIAVFIHKLALVGTIAVGHTVVFGYAGLPGDAGLLNSVSVTAVTAMTVGKCGGGKDRQQQQNCQHGANHSLHTRFTSCFLDFTYNTIEQRKSFHLFQILSYYLKNRNSKIILCMAMMLRLC